MLIKEISLAALGGLLMVQNSFADPIEDIVKKVVEHIRDDSPYPAFWEEISTHSEEMESGSNSSTPGKRNFFETLKEVSEKKEFSDDSIERIKQSAADGYKPAKDVVDALELDAENSLAKINRILTPPSSPVDLRDAEDEGDADTEDSESISGISQDEIINESIYCLNSTCLSLYSCKNRTERREIEEEIKEYFVLLEKIGCSPGRIRNCLRGLDLDPRNKGLIASIKKLLTE
ncbi:MAG: hypothetical protein LBG13_00585 [Holosporales bacterium]|jgi:hypothetical protein|nr:hypothetical protein [Holosporales bacterium]